MSIDIGSLSNVIAFLILVALYLVFCLCQGYGANPQYYYYPHYLRPTVAAVIPPPRRLEDNDRIIFDKYMKQNSTEDGGGCVICLDDYKDGETRAAITPCNHRFHAVCIKAWLGKNDNCPLCRSSIAV